MRTQNNLALKMNINASEIEQVLALRRTYEAQKKRLEIAENALLELERSIIGRIQAGAAVISSRDVQIKTIERRNVAWKGIVCELIGSERTEQILNQTEVSISYRLLIKEAA